MLKIGRPPRKFTTQEAADLYNSGMTFEQVAIVLSQKYGEKVAKNTVIHRLKKEGMELKKRRPMTGLERTLRFKEKRKVQKQENTI